MMTKGISQNRFCCQRNANSSRIVSAPPAALRNHLATSSAAVARLAPRRGRPRKFIAPSRPVTLTLPEHVIDALTAVDPD